MFIFLFNIRNTVNFINYTQKNSACAEIKKIGRIKMLNKYFNKIISIFLTMVFITGIFPPVIFAQPSPSSLGEVKGFNRTVIDSHFSKADWELTPERWLTEAKLGVTQAICAWEFFAVGLYENPVLYEEAKNQLIKWSDEELEKRFSQWLMGRFFGKAAEEAYLNLSKMFNESQKNYSWHLDEDGNVIFDDKTGDPLVIRPNEEGREFSQDLALWRNDTNEIVKTSGASFDNLIDNLFPELLAYIPSDLRESMNAIIKETLNYQSGAIKREFENIAAREERIFINRRTRDIWSLRKKSDNESAKIFTEKLIAETDESCKKGIEEINSKIEQAAAGTGDLALLGEEWLSLYKEQFERGLKAWEDAEERFFIRRIEWEQESFRLFAEGEDIWLSAFNQFEEERQKWELNAKELFQTGETLFRNISEDFEKTIAEAKKEFELNITIRIGEGTNKVKALIDMYLVCASAAVSSMDNIKFWQKQFGNNDKNIKEPDFLDWIFQEIINVWKQVESAYLSDPFYINDFNKLENLKQNLISMLLSSKETDTDTDIDTEFDTVTSIVTNNDTEINLEIISETDTELDPEIIEALRIYNQYLNVFNEKYSELILIQNIIAGNITLPEQINLAKGMNSKYFSKNKFEILIEMINSYNVYLQYIEKSLDARDRIYENYAELFGTGALKDILSSDVSSEDFYLDEYQIALIRAKALVMYWERKTSIADAVMTYAVELNAGRMTEAEGILAWENAKAAYNESLAAYEIELGKLNEIGENIQQQQEILYYLAVQMQKEEDILNNLYSDYSTLISISSVNLENFYSNEFNEKYNEFVKKYKTFQASGVNSVYYSALEYGMLWGIAEQRETAELIEYLLETYNDLSDEEIEALCNYYIALSPMFQTELWENTCYSLSLLFENYNLETEANMFPNVKSICLAILDRPGDFAQNTARFLMDFDNCFYMIPEWLQYEIDNWKNALVEYITIYALSRNIEPENTEKLFQFYIDLLTEYNNLCEYAGECDFNDDDEVELLNNAITEIINKLKILELTYNISESWEMIKSIALTENETHWRQYLSASYITNKDSALESVSSWTAGILADALYYANYYTNRINDSFSIYSQKDLYDIDKNADQLYDLYSNEISQIIYDFNSLIYEYNEIANSAKTMSFSKLSPNEIKDQLITVEEAIKIQEEALNLLRDNYYNEAEIFFNIGSQYDNQYTNLKKAHNNTDQKRFEYEKQDAIQRWAGTSYINTDNIGLDNCKANLLKAQTVLNVLSDISNNENRLSGGNPEHDALYAAYEQSFTKKIIALEAERMLSAAYYQEIINNENIYNRYQNSLFQLGRHFNYENYQLPDSESDWKIENIITVNNGRLVFSRDEYMNITGVDSSEAKNVIDFFNSTKSVNGEEFDITSYEEALRGLSQRMSGYFNDPNKYFQWSFARNYLISSLINSNSGLKFLDNYLSLQGELCSIKTVHIDLSDLDSPQGGSGGLVSISDRMGEPDKNGSLASEYIKENLIKNKETLGSFMERTFFSTDAEALFRNEWNKLSAEEKADLEFYIILTLTTGTDYFAGFSQIYTYQAYQFAYSATDSFYRMASTNYNHPLQFFNKLIWKEMMQINKSTLNRIEPIRSETAKIVNKWTNGLKNNLNSINNLSALYTESCHKLDELRRNKTEDSFITWDDLEEVFIEIKMKSENINILKTCWEEMLQNNTNVLCKNIFEAIATLSYWTDIEVFYSKNNLETRLSADMKNQKSNEDNFLAAVNKYFNGTSDIETVKTAAETAYGKINFSKKYHFDNMYDTLINSLSLYMNTEYNFFPLFNNKGQELIFLTADSIMNKYDAELSVREAEWDLMRRDIAEKMNEWQKTAAQIFENGRTDWTENYKKLENAYKQWNVNFQSEYERVNNEWAQAYLAGLEDKEMWLQQAADAVNHASSESFLSLIGAEGERLSRFVDTREPFGIRNAIPETQALMTNLLQSSGIVNMANTFSSLNNFTGITSPLVKRGIGGITSWDSALVKTAASDLARETNAKIADGESKKLAYSVRITADEVIKSLTDTVNTANISFKENMDNLFIFKGLWRRNGNGYAKDIIEGSTLFQPVISKTVYISGYKNYNMEPVILKTNLDENYLASLNTIAIQGLINNVYVEVQTIADEIFGIGKDTIKINTHEKEREQSPGKFGAHIGYGPAGKKLEEATKVRSEIFHDEGAGELGRLMSDFQYWYIIDRIGSAELSLPPWDKRMWDDEGSWFPAPSLRTVGTIACSIVAGIATAGIGGFAGIALSVGISSASEIAFGMLDISGGYKTIDEAAFNIGKTILINSVTSFAGSLFNGIEFAKDSVFDGLINIGVEKAHTAFDKVLTKTILTGTQTFTTGISTSILSGITYNNKDGFGYSGEIFTASMKGMLTNSLVSMTSVFTTTGLTAINSGLDYDKLKGFNNRFNQADLQNFNGLIGSLAGQGVNYALGNDFTLNVLNLSLLTGNKNYSSGLLELHLGRDGVNMNIGTGGANVSIDNLISAYLGAQVWDINTKISKYGKENDFDALITLRAQYGYGDNVQKNQLWDILNGKAIIDTETEGYNIAEVTINEDGKRVIHLAGYEKGLSDEDQFLLATLLGYAAYRDGYKIGETNASGKIVTEMSQFNEIAIASFASQLMGARIQEEHGWFNSVFNGFDYGNFLLKEMNIDKTFGYEDYLEQFYSTGIIDFSLTNKGDFQGNYSDIPLLYSATKADENMVNEKRLKDAFYKYASETRPNGQWQAYQALYDFFEANEDLQEKNEYRPVSTTTISEKGCMFMCVKYGLEKLLGREVNTIDLHEFIKNRGHVTAGTDNILSRWLMATIWTEYSNGEYTVEYLDDFGESAPTLEMLNKFKASNDQYIIHLRIKDPLDLNQNTDGHSLMVSSIEYTKDKQGNITGISKVIVANSLRPANNFYAKSSYLPGEILRWDYFLITKN
jgi:hypothetical protein